MVNDMGSLFLATLNKSPGLENEFQSEETWRAPLLRLKILGASV